MNKRKKKGQSIVELALVFPFFLLIVVGGIIDFGFAFYNFLSLQQLANDTAQWAADKKVTLDSEIIKYVSDKKPKNLVNSFTVQTIERPTLTTGEKAVKITLGYESPTYTPFYQTLVSATTGSSGIKLVAVAVYKVPTTLGPRN